MSGAADNLSAKQDKAIAALLSEPTIAAAADKLGVNDRQIYRWLEESEFVAAYRAARREAVGQAIARLQQTSSHAVTVLLSLMADRKTPATVRLNAASKVLEFAVKAIELDDIQARLEALEQANAQKL